MANKPLFRAFALLTWQAALFGDVCSWTDGKGGGCSATPGEAERPRPVSEFRQPGPWTKSNHAFQGDFDFDIRQSKGSWTTTVDDVGPRVKKVRYSSPHGEFAGILLVETQLGSGRYIPLMRWSGDAMPAAKVQAVRVAGDHTVMVLTMAKDYGGNVPMWSQWAWSWAGDALPPHSIDVWGALRNAVQTVAPGYGGYDTLLNWQTLSTTTWIWKGKYPGKVGVSEGMSIWFALSGDGQRLEPVRAEQFHPDSGATGSDVVYKKWRRR